MTHMTQQLLFWVYAKELKAVSGRDIYALMFIAALFTIAKTWKQPKCPSMDEWIKQTAVYINNGILFSLKKDGNFATKYNMEEP